MSLTASPSPEPLLIQIYPDTLHLRVVLERVHAHLAAEAALFVAAKRRSGVVDVVRVDPDCARLQLARDVMRLLDVPGPHRGGESVSRVVRAGDRLVDIGKLDGRKHRAEDLLARDGHLWRHAIEYRRLQKVPPAGPDVGAAAAGDEGGAFLLCDFDVSQVVVELRLRGDGAETRLRIHRIAWCHLLRSRRHLVDELALDRLVDEQPRSSRAHFSLAVE